MKTLKWWVTMFTFYYRWNRVALGRWGSFKYAIHLMRQPLPI